MQRSLTGKSSPVLNNLCAGRDLGDQIARGYVTVDTVSNCTLRDASSPAYFTSDISFQNVLWGDYINANSSQNFANGGALVHIEASTTDAATTTAGRYTFYGRYVGWNASDHREPLATNFAGRYALNGTFSGGTSFVVWRDPKVNQLAFACPSGAANPSWYPLSQEGIDVFDEQEHVEQPQLFPTLPPPQNALIPFPAATQRTKISLTDFPVPFDFGWIYLDLNTTITGNANPSFDPAASQAWLIYDMDSNGHFSVGFEGLRLDTACAPNHTVP